MLHESCTVFEVSNFYFYFYFFELVEEDVTLCEFDYSSMVIYKIMMENTIIHI